MPHVRSSAKGNLRFSAIVLLAWSASGQTADSDPLRASVEKQQASVARQREAVRRQAESVGAWLLPPGKENAAAAGIAVPAGDPCDAITEPALTPMIEAAAKAQDLQPKLLRSMIEQESAFRPCAVSVKGAKGLMQLMPETAADLGVRDPFDPVENIQAGARYIKQMLDRYKGDLRQALGAYNSGPATVDQAHGVPKIRETRDYVNAILQKLGSIQTDLPNIPMPKPIEN